LQLNFGPWIQYLSSLSLRKSELSAVYTPLKSYLIFFSGTLVFNILEKTLE